LLSESLLKLGYQDSIIREKMLRTSAKRDLFRPQYMKNFFLAIEFDHANERCREFIEDVGYVTEELAIIWFGNTLGCMQSLNDLPLEKEQFKLKIQL
jgi:hypothetical protein